MKAEKVLLLLNFGESLSLILTNVLVIDKKLVQGVRSNP